MDQILRILIYIVLGVIFLFISGVLIQRSMDKDAAERRKDQSKDQALDNPEMKR